MIDLEPIWQAYKNGDHVGSLNLALQGLDGGGLDLLHLIGLSLMKLKRHSDGLIFLKAATSLHPTSVRIHANAAWVAEQCGLAEESGAFADVGLVDFPNDHNLLLLKGNSLVVLLRFDEAEIVYRKLLDLNPMHAGAMMNLGNIARNRDEFAAAEAWYNAAEMIEPNLRELIFARATMHTQRGDFEAGIPLLEQISDDVDAQFLLSLLYLARGEYERGFRLYRDRSKSVWYRTGDFVYPLKPFDHWGEAIGKRIAVIKEGGFGDDIQFCRYLPLLGEIADVTFYVTPGMLRLFRHNLPTVKVHGSYTTPWDRFDYITTDLEMPVLFGTTLETIPDTIPYLSVPADVIQANLLPPSMKKRRVGLCWSGGERDRLNQRAYDVRRSFDLSTYAPLGQAPDIEFVSLQVGARADQRCDDLYMPHAVNRSGDFMDTAGVVMQLDLVISVDTAVAHLAAALGKPVWLLSRYDCCWRWLNNRPDSPWYPNVLRVFGQKAYDDWSHPIAEVVEALRDF